MQIPVYTFTGFLESGKTKFIQETLEDPRFNAGERTLLLVCEEGEEEYDLSRYPHKNVYLEILDDILAYQVDAINVVLPHDTTHLGITSGEDYCTLVTCTPFGVNTHRLLVRGTRIPYEEAEQITAEITVEEAVTSTWEEKYVNGILTGFTIVCLIAILGGVIWFSRRR